MLHFFRRMRQAFLADSKYRKYALYAIGEIALVMIGILLALQVNTWNQNRNNQKAKEEAVLDLHQEFASIKENLQVHLQFMNRVHGQWDDYLKIVTSPEAMKTRTLDFIPRSASKKFTPENSVLLSVLSTGKIDRIENKNLKNALTNWEAFFADFNFIQIWHDEFFRNELGAYQRKFIRSHIRIEGANKYQFPDFDATERMKEALSDRHFQNLQLTQFDLLKLKISNAALILTEVERIILLLQKELNL